VQDGMYELEQATRERKALKALKNQ
jgi:hypothetical protein